MIFMALVGGLGTFEGAILGAVLFFVIEALVRRGRRLVSHRPRRHGAGVRAVPAARASGARSRTRFGLRLLPVGYRLRSSDRRQQPTSAARGVLNHALG